MRTIKFRAKGIKSRRWYYGSLVGNNSIVEDYSGSADPFDKKAWYAIDLDTIGQYTGLKDEDGTEIYEGDLVLFPHDEVHHKAEIVFHQGCFCINFNPDYPWPLNDYRGEDLSVYGNIHDYPEHTPLVK